MARVKEEPASLGGGETKGRLGTSGKAKVAFLFLFWKSGLWRWDG